MLVRNRMTKVVVDNCYSWFRSFCCRFPSTGSIEVLILTRYPQLAVANVSETHIKKKYATLKTTSIITPLLTSTSKLDGASGYKDIHACVEARRPLLMCFGVGIQGPSWVPLPAARWGSRLACRAVS